MNTESAVRQAAERIERELERGGDSDRAAGAQRYLKSDLRFFGATTAMLRASVREALRELPASRTATVALAEALWRRGVFELRAAAVELLARRIRLLTPDDLPSLERLIRDSHTWALVDGLAPHVVGPLFERFPRVGAALDRWAGDNDFWVRRAALLALLIPLRRGGGDFERFGRYADSMLEDREFFIRKAIGWVLREVGKKRPGLVEEWLGPRAHRASGLTLREAARYLPASAREALLPDRRGRPRVPRAAGGVDAPPHRRPRRGR